MMNEKTLLAIDLGTTHCKAGLFGLDGRALYLASRDNPVQRHPAGYVYYDPTDLWHRVQAMLMEIEGWRKENGKERMRPCAVGVASMAETGLLFDPERRILRTPFIPWFDPIATAEAESLRELFDVQERFYRTGLRPAFKYSLAKILWLKEQDPRQLDGAIWLGVADYLVYLLSGVLTTDYSLAGRTYAFCIDRKVWDSDALSRLGIPTDLFAEAHPSGRAVVGALPGLEALGLAKDTPVAVSGHDHVCATFAAQALSGMKTTLVFDSIGTAESLSGVFPERPLGQVDFHSGFNFGVHSMPGSLYWMGGLSASGGSIEWLRSVLGDPPLGYDDLDALLASQPDRPTGILYFPYLAGSGSPHSDSRVRGAFIGLSATHTRADLYQAVLEGTALEAEFMRRSAERVTGAPVKSVHSAGGGTRNQRWMQIKADVFGCPLNVLAQREATLLGAALLAGLGCGVYPSEQSLAEQLSGCKLERYEPDAARHVVYRRLFQEGYLPLQEGLRSFKV
jgi:xylulokinase